MRVCVILLGLGVVAFAGCGGPEQSEIPKNPVPMEKPGEGVKPVGMKPGGGQKPKPVN